jgi:hypothetical protein
VDSSQLEFAATINEQGGFIPRDPGVRVRLAKWKKYGELTVIVKRFRLPKSNEQMGYYRVEILPAFAAHIGDDEDSTHLELKRAFFPKRHAVSKLTGEASDEIPSLSTATKEEMSEFMDRIIRYAATIGLPIAPPKGSPEWATWVAL